MLDFILGASLTIKLVLIWYNFKQHEILNILHEDNTELKKKLEPSEAPVEDNSPEQ